MDRLLAIPVPIIAAILQGFDGIQDWGIVTAFIAGVFTLGMFLDKIGILEMFRAKVVGRNGNGHRKGDGKVIANQAAIMDGVSGIQAQLNEKLAQRFRHPDHQSDDEPSGSSESVTLYVRDQIEGQAELVTEIRSLVEATNRHTDATLARIERSERLLSNIHNEFAEVKGMLGTLLSRNAS